MVSYMIGWSLGLMLAPFMGGLLAEPLVNYPSLSQQLPKTVVDFLQKFPFLLPNLTAAFLNVISIVIFWFKLKETRVKETPSLAAIR